MRTALLPVLALIALLGTARADSLPDPAALHLSDLDTLIIQRNRALISARRATAAAEAGLTQAGARPNPSVSLNRSRFTTRRPEGIGNIQDTVLRIDQPFERGGKRELRLAVAEALVAASKADEADSLRQQQWAARQAYFDLKAGEERARLSRESAQLARDLLNKAELRLKAGDLSPAEVARIRTDSLRAASEATLAGVELQRLRRELATLLALEAEAGRLASADPWPALTPLPAVNPDPAQRPDIAAARQRLAAAEQAIALARAQQVRDVTVGAQFERDQTIGNSNLFGVGLSIPLFTGYDYQGEISRAHVDRDSQQDELERLEAQALAEFTQARLETEQLGERARELRDQALPAARKAFQAVQLAFNHGAASALELIDARRSLHAVEIDTIQALADAAKARAAWSAALNRRELP
ncbi:MAG: hypothetical protein RIR00_772 [Pseudomonadota bacterium]